MATGQIAAPGSAADPRIGEETDAIGTYQNRVLETLHDPNVQLEEYLYYAELSRSYESGLSTDVGYSAAVKRLRSANNGTEKMSILSVLKGKGASHGEEHDNAVERDRTSDGKGDTESSPSQSDDEKRRANDTSDEHSPVPDGYPTESEWFHASRALRTATWGAVFYLITTDILGPYSVPWAMTQLGYGPGAVLYTVFAGLAFYSGLQIWRLFIHLDSDRYPVKVYGDLAFRVFGNWARVSCNILQSVQFFLNVGLLILTYGQSIYQLARGELCFVVCLVVFMVAGFLVGQIRTLQRFGYLANVAVWLNLIIIFITMGVVAHSNPNYTAAMTTYMIPKGPVTHSAGLPKGLTFNDNVVGLMQAVFSYGGATLFCEILAEMRRPMDFWKGLFCADLFIYCVYIIFGLYVYGFQGQFAYNPAFQGINPYNFQTAANSLGVISSLIAACLYGNIGIKILYANVGQELLHAPSLTQKSGKVLFAMIVPCYWAAAFAVCAAIPQISNFQALVGAACILQFTYTFPPILTVGLNCKRDGRLPEDTFDPASGRVNRADTGLRRYWRGFRKQWLRNTWDVVYALGAATTGVLGIYSAIVGIIEGYQENPALTSFSCQSPTG